MTLDAEELLAGIEQPKKRGRKPKPKPENNNESAPVTSFTTATEEDDWERLVAELESGANEAVAGRELSLSPMLGILTNAKIDEAAKEMEEIPEDTNNLPFVFADRLVTLTDAVNSIPDRVSNDIDEGTITVLDKLEKLEQNVKATLQLTLENHDNELLEALNVRLSSLGSIMQCITSVLNRQNEMKSSIEELVLEVRGIKRNSHLHMPSSNPVSTDYTRLAVQVAGNSPEVTMSLLPWEDSPGIPTKAVVAQLVSQDNLSLDRVDPEIDYTNRISKDQQRAIINFLPKTNNKPVPVSKFGEVIVNQYKKMVNEAPPYSAADVVDFMKFSKAVEIIDGQEMINAEFYYANHPEMRPR